MDCKQGEEVQRVGEIREEMEALDQEIAACMAQAHVLHEVLDCVLRAVDYHDPPAGQPVESGSPMAKWLRKRRESVIQMRLYIEALDLACEL